MFITDIKLKNENVNGEFKGEGHTYKTETISLAEARASVRDIIWQSIELDNLIGRVIVEVNIEEQGEWVDGDDYLLHIEKVVHKDTPSDFVQWGDKKPHLFTVDREKSVVLFESGGIEEVLR